MRVLSNLFRGGLGYVGATMAIKPAYVKKTGRLLMERYPDAFAPDFEHNKDLIDELTNIESKGVRNRIAGYVTHKQGGTSEA
jgi:small subunit ribosomal protein S17e